MTPSLADRLRALVRREPDGRLGATVRADRAVDLVARGTALLDVRERGEWKAGHAPQAVHVPLAELDRAPRRLRQDEPVLVICASGMRSRTAAKRLRGLGFDAASVAGGMSAWQAAGGAVRR